MATNDFLPFATAGGANVVSQVTYAGLAALSTGYQSGVANSAQLNKTWRQSSIMSAVLAQFVADLSGQNSVDDGTTTTLLANLKQVAAFQASPRVLGLVGNNNTTTPNTQFDFAAAGITLRNPTTGNTVSTGAVATITNNIATAGPAANGRDQAGAFSTSSWVHFYFIYNPSTTTVATLSSASATTPTLPTGYTYAAYIGALYLSAGGQLIPGRFRGSWFYYDNQQVAINGGTSTSLVSVSLTTLIPPNALQVELVVPNLAISASAGGVYALTCLIVYIGTATAFQFGLQGTGGASAVFGVAGPAKRIPNQGQNFAYQLVITSGAGPTVTINVCGYSVPNGGE